MRDTVVVDAVREIPAPFSPEVAVAELAQLLKSYAISSVVGDRYAGMWPRESFGRHGIDYELSPAPKSVLYGSLLPLLNSERVELPDNPRLVAQLANLERRTARGGRDSIDHSPGSHDDIANAPIRAATSAATAAELRLGVLMRPLMAGAPQSGHRQARPATASPKSSA
jgi:hypothetical protein